MSSAIQRSLHQFHSHQYQHADVHIDSGIGAAMLYMTPSPRPCFTPALLKDILAFQDAVMGKVKEELSREQALSIRYLVFASGMPGLYSLGGDLNLFSELILKRDRDALLDYAMACINVVHRFSTCMDLPLTSIALVQGNAQGGGFEAALSCNVIIAERGVRMGFPEVLFNLFPGMGAYTFLRRRISHALTERMVLSGELYPVEQLHEMGVVDLLADPGKGEEILRGFMRDTDKRAHVRNMLRYANRHYNPVSYDELAGITELWVDSALSLNEREIKTMLRLVKAQNRKRPQPESISLVGSNQAALLPCSV